LVGGANSAFGKDSTSARIEPYSTTIRRPIFRATRLPSRRKFFTFHAETPSAWAASRIERNKGVSVMLISVFGCATLRVQTGDKARVFGFRLGEGPSYRCTKGVHAPIAF